MKLSENKINNQVRFRGFVKIEPLVYSAAKTYKLEAAFYQQKISKQWDKVLADFFKDSEGKTKVIAFANGVLTVACLCRQLAYEIKTLAGRLVYILNQLLGRPIIRAISVQE